MLQQGHGLAIAMFRPTTAIQRFALGKLYVSITITPSAILQSMALSSEHALLASTGPGSRFRAVML